MIGKSLDGNSIINFILLFYGLPSESFGLKAKTTSHSYVIRIMFGGWYRKSINNKNQMNTMKTLEFRTYHEIVCHTIHWWGQFKVKKYYRRMEILLMLHYTNNCTNNHTVGYNQVYQKRKSQNGHFMKEAFYFISFSNQVVD